MDNRVFRELLAELGKTLGLQGLAAEEDGECVLAIDGRLVLTIALDEQSDLLTLYCELGDYAAGAAVELQRRLLEANCLWAGTGGATLGVDSARQTVMFAYRQPLGLMSFDEFFGLVQNFVNNAEHWMGRVQEIQRDAGAMPGMPSVNMNLSAHGVRA